MAAMPRQIARRTKKCVPGGCILQAGSANDDEISAEPPTSETSACTLKRGSVTWLELDTLEASLGGLDLPLDPHTVNARTPHTDIGYCCDHAR